MHEVFRSHKFDRLLMLREEGRSATPTQAAELEKHLEENGDDIEARARLLGFYLARLIGPNNERGTLTAHRKHLLWLAENVPGFFPFQRVGIAKKMDLYSRKVPVQDAAQLWDQSNESA